MEKALLATLESAYNNAELWLRMWQKHKDSPARRNALFGIGRFDGAWKMYRSTGFQTPQYIKDAAERYELMFDELL